jgi:outer membrane receptor protein involved in Fe transport
MKSTIDRSAHAGHYGLMWGAFLCAAGIALAAPALAIADSAQFNIPAQPLPAALKTFAAQADMQLLYKYDVVEGARGNQVIGDFEKHAALRKLLRNTGFTAVYSSDSAATIIRSDASPASNPGGSAQGADAAPLAASSSADQSNSSASQPSAAPQGRLREVVVTGSRVTVLPGMSTPTPVTSVPVNQLLATGPATIVQGLAALPSLSNSTTPASKGGSTTLGEGSFLNLRNLGTAETLVLLDGNRLPPNNIQNNVDASLLPEALISSVDVVTGGASAAYGSDAVAGVVNFILNTHFTGFKVDVGSGRSSVGDGGSDKLSLAWGAPFADDRVHVIASFNWLHSQAADAANRPWAHNHCAVVNTPGVTTATESPTNPLTQFACNVTAPNASYGGAIYSGPLTTPTQGITFGPGGVPEPFIYGALHTTNFQVGGTGAYDDDDVNFVAPLDTKVGFTHIEYDVSDNLQAWAQLTASRSVSEYSQTPAFLDGTRPVTIYSGNPFIPPSIQAQMTALDVSSFQLGIVPESWGNVEANSHEETYDALAGLKGAFGKGWSWQFHLEHGRTEWEMTMPGNLDLPNVYRGLDAVLAPNGTVVCASALVNPALYGNCVPIDPFGPGAASPEALAYIHGNGALATDVNVMTQDDAAASINGTPFSLWAGPVSFSAGAEWRRLSGVQTDDALSEEYPVDYTDILGVPSAVAAQHGGWLTTNAQPYSGSYDVTEGYMEFLMPLARNLTFAKELDLNAAGRVTDYSQSGLVETWKAGLTWRPIDDLLFRVTESRDIRAPNIANLYAGLSTGPVTVTDPFAGGGSFEIKDATSGNPDLVPERAKTFTVGTTYQPSWLSGFAVSVDYYNIKIADVLASYTAQQELNYCYAGDQSLCQYISRDSNGQIVLIQIPTLNLNEAQTSGLDLDVDYRTSLGRGKLSTRLIGTRLYSQSTTEVIPTGNIVSQYADDLSYGSPTWLLNLITSYDRGPIGFDLSGRFVSSGEFNTTYVVGELAPADQNLPSNFTLNAGIRYTLRSLPGAPELYFTMTNVLNKAPPIIPGTALTGFDTNAELYDTMGRYFFGGVRMEF